MIPTDWANADAWADWADAKLNADANTTPDNTGKDNNENWSQKEEIKTTPAERYQISRERELRKQAEARAKDLETKLNEKKPVFDEKTDPDGSQELDYKVKEWVQKGIQEYLSKLGIEDKVAQIEYENSMNEFAKKSISVWEELLWKYDIKLSKEEILNTMKTVDEKGFTHDDLVFLAKKNEILERLKPGNISPGEWQKVDASKPLTQAEINASIYKRHGAFWF